MAVEGELGDGGAVAGADCGGDFGAGGGVGFVPMVEGLGELAAFAVGLFEVGAAAVGFLAAFGFGGGDGLGGRGGARRDPFAGGGLRKAAAEGIAEEGEHEADFVGDGFLRGVAKTGGRGLGDDDGEARIRGGVMFGEWRREVEGEKGVAGFGVLDRRKEVSSSSGELLLLILSLIL